MDKLERLLNLTAALLDTSRPLSAEELRSRVGGYPEAKASFRRTFERDKDDLRSMGVPIRVEPVGGTDPPVDGYRIDPSEYSGAEQRLDPDELAALHLATNLVRLDGGAAPGLAKLGLLDEEPDTRHDETPDAVANVPFDDGLAVLVGAATARSVVRFRYRGEPRSVEPWRVSFTGGRWYVSGFDRDRRDERVFRVDRMEGPVEVSGEAEAPVPDHAGPVLRRAWELGDGEPVIAKLRVGPDQAAWARHATGAQGDAEPDGSTVFSLEVRNPDAFRSLALTFLDHGEVLEPAHLRQAMVDWLKALT